MNTDNSAEFAHLAGVSVKTLQGRDREGRLKPAARTAVLLASQAKKPDLAHQKAAIVARTTTAISTLR